MLRFFRTIRQRLLTENRFSKYLLYAVGEILLVVIGILIALQIDNWNEERKTRLTEKEVLTALRDEIDQNLEKVENARIQADTVAKNAVLLANLINRDQDLTDSIKISRLLFNCFFDSPGTRLNNGVINDVINSGKLNIIQNGDLRTKLAAFQAEKEGLQMQQDFIQTNYNKLLEMQLEYGNFRKHRFLLQQNFGNESGLDDSTRPVEFDFIKRASFENYLLMYEASLNTYQGMSIEIIKNYLSQTRELIEQELAE